jgi:hypothetical protein
MGRLLTTPYNPNDPRGRERELQKIPVSRPAIFVSGNGLYRYILRRVVQGHVIGGELFMHPDSNPSSVQQVYEDHVATLSPAERLRLVELITRHLAKPLARPGSISREEEILPDGTWQPIDHRGDLTEWRDRVL